MTLSLAQPKDTPPRILVYGMEGLGKTTIGTLAPNPVFIPTERGLIGYPEIAQYPVAQSMGDVIGYLQELYEQPHDYKTVVVDTVDALQRALYNQLKEESGVSKLIEVDGGYGAYKINAADKFKQYLDCLDALNQERDMIVLQIGHAKTTKYTPPDGSAYDIYSLKLQEGGDNANVMEMLMEHSDIVGFLKKPHLTTEVDKVNAKKAGTGRTIGVTNDKRFLHTKAEAAFRAKNRYSRFGFPDKLELDMDGNYWHDFIRYVPYLNNLYAGVLPENQTSEKEGE